MKRFLSLVLMLMMALSCVAMAEVTPKGELPIVKGEEVTLTIAMPLPSKVQDFDTNQFTLWIEEQTGINIKLMQLSESDALTQVNTLFFNNEGLPDMIWGVDLTPSQLASFADAGYIVPITEQVEKYGVHFQNAIETSGIVNGIEQLKYDGEIYCMPAVAIQNNSMYCKFRLNYNKAFLEALKMEEPKTLDEFYNYLVGVRDQDVNGNGDPNDEIPMTTYKGTAQYIWDIIGSCFQYTNSVNFLKLNGDTIEFVANNALYKETVEYVKKMVAEGLYDPASWTQAQADVLALNTQEYSITGANAAGWMSTRLYDTSSRDFYNLRAVLLEGPYGYKATRVTYPEYWQSMFVTSACENLDAAYRLMDFMMSHEAAMMGRYGAYGAQYKEHSTQEGKWELIGSQEWSNPSTNVIWDMDKMLHLSAAIDGSFGVRYNEEFGDYGSAYYTINKMSEEVYPKFVTGEEVPYLSMDSDMAAEYDELLVRIQAYVREQSALFAIGDRPMEQWDDYCNELKAMGVDRYVELAQQAYNTTYGK